MSATITQENKAAIFDLLFNFHMLKGMLQEHPNRKCTKVVNLTWDWNEHRETKLPCELQLFVELPSLIPALATSQVTGVTFDLDLDGNQERLTDDIKNIQQRLHKLLNEVRSHRDAHARSEVIAKVRKLLHPEEFALLRLDGQS